MDLIQQTLLRVYYLLFQKYWLQMRYVQGTPPGTKDIVPQSHEVQATLEVTGSTGTTGVLWDCAGGREMENGLEGHSRPNRSPELMRQISSCLSKTSHPEFLNYWSLNFSYFVLILVELFC